MRTWPAIRVSGLAAVPDADVPPSDLLHAALVDHPVAAIEELSTDEWLVFFQSADERVAAATALSSDFPFLAITTSDVDDEDWAAKSQASLHAVRVGSLIVSPPWDPASDPQAVRLVIQPSMGFGTGHHATTRLCLAALQAIPLTGHRVLDVGTGSGVLAIAASVLGAAEVIAIDDDGDAVQAARDNLDLNPAARVALSVGDLRAFDADAFDVVTANLTGALLCSAATRLVALTRPAGTLILSGLMRSEVDAVQAAFAECELAHRGDEDEWVSLVLERKETR